MMALSQRLDLRHVQTLVMTPQLQQAIKLLQLSNIELADFVEQEVERNPLLEVDETGAAEMTERVVLAERVVEQGPPADRAPADRVGTDALVAGDRPTGAADQPLDMDFADIWVDGETGGAIEWGGAGTAPDDRDGAGLERAATSAPDLRSLLLSQVNMAFRDPADRAIGAQLVELLDDRGYLTPTAEDVAAQLDVPAGRVRAVLDRLKRFEPTGIFAADLAECLALQLRERDRLDPAMQTLLAHIGLLARRDYGALCRLCGVDQADLADMIAEIRALDPKPAAAFSAEPSTPVIPDVLMRAAPGGGWIVELNSETLPRVIVNQRYYKLVSAAARSRADREYLSDCASSANWLVKSLHQRATTILKVASDIVRQQEAFFLHGVRHLKPLILRDVAEAIGMHESTVSRVTTNKFIATPRGVFELKYFFTAAIAASDGGISHSAEAVRFRIRTLIGAEKPDEILSDDRIVEILREDGVDIARRTVAKYREGMRIASSVQRRREKSKILS